MASLKVLASIARGVEGAYEIFDTRVIRFAGCGRLDAEEAPTASLVPVIHKNRSDCSADVVHGLGFFA